MKKSTPSKIKFYVISISSFFSMMDIKMFTTGGFGEGHAVGGGEMIFFERVTISFHQCNNTNITY